MATYDLIEFGEAPVRAGNALAMLPLPIVKKQVANTGATVTLLAGTRFVRIRNASADIAYKAATAQASVEGANVPAAATDLVLKTTDPAQDHILAPGTRYFRAE